MKTKNMKKALSLFLAVLMIALALPFTLLTVAAEEPAATTIAKIESTKAAYTSEYVIETGVDGKLETAYLANGQSEFRYGVTDGAFGSGSTYRDYITVELSALSAMTSVTIWGGSDKTAMRFTNNQFDVYYSADGETWTLHSEYSNVCGNGTSAGAGSVGFTEERTVGENTYYGLK
ncbi:MAG: discoidin domain-containing protein, partial [Clostridia bacterium]|nr:discoidin domain-containing protein [Clostridia bacterium]